MASNLGSMQIQLGANYATLQSDLGKAALLNERFAKQMQERWTAFGAGIGTVVGASAAGIGFAVAAMAKKTIDAMDQLDEAAQRVGISARSLSTLEYAAQRGGIQMEAFEAGLVKLTRAASDTARGTGDAAKGFAALGLSVKGADGSLKSTDVLLKEIAAKFAGYRDGAEKTALAVNLFGRSGAELIPMLNQGAEGIEEMQARARDLGLELADGTASAAGRFNDALDDLRALAKGAGNDIATELLPVITKLAEAIAESGIKARETGVDYSWLSETLVDLARYYQTTRQEAEVLTNVFAASVDTIGGVGDVLNGLLSNLGYAGTSIVKMLGGDIAGAQEDARLAGVALEQGWTEGVQRIVTAWDAAGSGIETTSQNTATTMEKLAGAIDSTAARAEAFRNVIAGVSTDSAAIVEKWDAAFTAWSGKGSGTEDRPNAPRLPNTGAADKAAAQAKKTAAEIARLQQQMQDGFDKLTDMATSYVVHMDEIDEANATFADRMRDVGRAAAEQAEKIEASRALTSNASEAERQHAELQLRVANAVKTATAARDRSIAAINKERDALRNKAFTDAWASVHQMTRGLQEQLIARQAMVGVLGEMTEVQRAGVEIQILSRGLTKEENHHLQEKVDRLMAQARALDAVNQQLSNQRELTDLVANAFDMIGGDGARAFSNLRDAASEAISTIVTKIGEMQKASKDAGVALGATGEGWGGMAADIGTRLAIAAGKDQAATGEGAAVGAALGAIIGSFIPVIGTALGALIGGFVGGLFDSERKYTARINAQRIDEEFARGPFGNIYTGQAGADQQRDLAGRFRDFDRSIAEFLDNSQIAQVTASLATWSARAGSGEDLVAMRLERILGALGSEISDFVTGFSSDTATRVQALADVLQLDRLADAGELVTGTMQETLDAVMQFGRSGERIAETYKRMSEATIDVEHAMRLAGLGAGALGEDVTELAMQIGAALGATEKAHELWAQFFEQFYDETERGLANVSKLAENASKQLGDIGLSAGDFQGEAGMRAFRDLFESQLPTLSADAIAQWLEAAAALGDATTAQEEYNRALAQAALDYIELIGGLKVELGDSTGFAESEALIKGWMQATIDQANALARAAGLQGAAEQDLVLIHRTAAKRIADLIEQLKGKTQDLAVQLGYIRAADTVESLDAAIAALGQTALDTSDAVASAVDSMRERMNLLLGDLSPFNDQEKLRMALEGLRAGTVDPQQVLEIGRRLYASTSNYRNLFEQVMGMSAGGFSGSTRPADEGSAPTGDGRTLQELIAARDALLTAQRPELADQLARRLAELSSATGDDFTSLAEDMGFTLTQLAEDLSLSDEQLGKYLQSLLEQFDAPDFSQAADSITRSIDTSRDAIVAAIQGKPVDDIIAAADARTADIAREQAAAEDERSQRATEAVTERLDSLISAIVQSTRGQTDELVQVQRDTQRDLREARLSGHSNTSRRDRVLER